MPNKKVVNYGFVYFSSETNRQTDTQTDRQLNVLVSLTCYM